MVVDKKDFRVPAGTKKILLKSAPGVPAKLTAKSAQKLVDAGVRLIGTDDLSTVSYTHLDVYKRQGKR